MAVEYSSSSEASGNRWPNIKTLQQFIDWEKNVPEAQLRTWLVDMYCKGELATHSGMIQAFTMHSHGVEVSMVGAPVEPKQESVVRYERR